MFECSYNDFNQLFGVKKHKLDQSNMLVMCYKYLLSLHLFMPTMEINRGQEIDSDYEEEVRIAQKDI